MKWREYRGSLELLMVPTSKLGNPCPMIPFLNGSTIVKDIIPWIASWLQIIKRKSASSRIAIAAQHMTVLFGKNRGWRFVWTRDSIWRTPNFWLGMKDSAAPTRCWLLSGLGSWSRLRILKWWPKPWLSITHWKRHAWRSNIHLEYLRLDLILDVCPSTNRLLLPHDGVDMQFLGQMGNPLSHKLVSWVGKVVT